MTITPRSVQKWVQERVQNDPYNLHAKNPCGFHATLFVQRVSQADHFSGFHKIALKL